MARQMYPDIQGTFVNTGLEYPEIVRFVKSLPNIQIIRPKMSFKEVLDKYGYPVISKDVSAAVHELTNGTTEHIRNKRLYGYGKTGVGKLPLKYRYLLNAPFKISSYCCNVLKKQPLNRYYEETGLYPMVGVMAEESRLRLTSYTLYSCNAFNLKTPQGRPMMFWKKEDTMRYLKQYGIDYCKDIYGEILENPDGSLMFEKEDRTGCTFCMFGVHLEKSPNRFQRLQVTHPQLWKYCLEDLGLKPVLEYLGVPYKNEQLDMFKELKEGE